MNIKTTLLMVSLLDLSFHYPLLTALILSGYFIYIQLEDSLQQTMTRKIHDSWLRFQQFLKDLAKERGVSLRIIRKEAVEKLQQEPLIDKETDELIREDFSLRELIEKTVVEYQHYNSERIWSEHSVEEALIYYDFDEDGNKIEPPVEIDPAFETFQSLLPDYDTSKGLTRKDYRQLKTKLKSLYVSTDGSVVDEKLKEIVEYILVSIETICQ